ncbi:hypothetical protein J4233_00860 [Candidatus Pacearchaeota archaeon]|nr:hypothetical protein [uncultured archaeon]AQS28824.1 hypothetical protein [uncultured archaeon]AQS29011.1 hypothetical protein [uncultured archaeon]AQS29645.1 hypothetical protein [uncultured archaeon]MBS3076800.1 hypothetical protein [Candidatus Pacearchaeota archaeon]
MNDRKSLMVNWIGAVLNYFIILFVFIKALRVGILDIVDISLTLFGLIVSVFILIVKAVNR